MVTQPKTQDARSGDVSIADDEHIVHAKWRNGHHLHRVPWMAQREELTSPEDPPTLFGAQVFHGGAERLFQGHAEAEEGDDAVGGEAALGHLAAAGAGGSAPAIVGVRPVEKIWFGK